MIEIKFTKKYLSYIGNTRINRQFISFKGDAMTIKNIVSNLVKLHATRDPLIIAKGEGISIEYDDYDDTKGYFIKINNSKIIVVNQNLDDFMMLFVVAHELGHALLHHRNANILKFDKGMAFIHDNDLFRTNCKYEYEANLFAIELLKYTFIHQVIPDELAIYIKKYMR